MTQTIVCPIHHIEFEALDGCPKCLAEKETARPAVRESPTLVKVKYRITKDAGTENEHYEFEGRPYTYFTEEPLEMGDVVEVPIQGHSMKAQVVEIDVPESAIEAFRDKVKTIPAGSKVPLDFEEPREVTEDNRTPGEKAAEIESETVEFEPVPELPVAQVAKLFDTEPDQEINLPSTITLAPLELIDPAEYSKVLALYNEIDKILRAAQERVIQNDEDVKLAGEDLGIIAKVKSAVNEKRTEYLKPFNEKVNEIRAAFKTLLDPLEEADKLTRGQVKTYRDDAAAKAAEARRIEEKKLELAQDEMALKGEHTQELNTAVVTEPPRVVHTSQSTVGGREVWHYEITDFAALPDDYKLPNTSLLNSLAKSTKGTKEVPGVRFYSENEVTVRKR